MACFARHDGGSIATIAAITTVPLLMCIGLAVDFGNTMRVRTGLQKALDAAMLGAASPNIAANVVPADMARTYLTENFTAARGLPAPTLSITSGSGKLIGTAALSVPTPFLSLMGYNTVPVQATSAVALGAGKLEVALALDTTASMAGQKLDDLKLAAKDLIDILVTNSPVSSQDKPRVGIVPFGAYINVGTQYRSAPWITVPADSTSTYTSTSTVGGTQTCTTGPTQTCYADGVPYACSSQNCTTTGGTQVTTTYTDTISWFGCVGSRSSPVKADVQTAFSTSLPDEPVPGVMGNYCGTPLSRLTSDSQAMKATVDALVAAGDTYIPDGVLWAWRLISPDAPFADGTAPATNTDVRKVVVLMTDGYNTLEQSGPYHITNGSGATSGTATDPITVELCTNLKAQNVTIFTIAFGVTDARAASVLQQCASGPPFYFSAASGSELRDAFRSAGMAMVSARLVQ